MDINNLIKINQNLKDYGFCIEEKNISESFGNYYITYSSDYFKLRFVNDRDANFIDISPLTTAEKWTPISLIRLLIEKREYSKKTNFIEEKEFILRNINSIKELFNLDNFQETEKKINIIIDKRSKSFLKNYE